MNPAPKASFVGRGVSSARRKRQAMRRVAIIGGLALALGAAWLLMRTHPPRERDSVPSALPFERSLGEGEAEVVLAEPVSAAAESQRTPLAARPAAGTAERAVSAARRGTPPELAMRLLDSAGNALAEREVRTRFDWTVGGAVSAEGGTLQTDGDGRASFSLAGPRGPRTTSTLELRAAVPGGGELAGRIELQPPLSTGGGDAGDVVLHACALLVEGCVVDERAEPVRSANVRIQAWASERWSTEAFVQVDADGHFASYGEVSGAELRLLADGRAFTTSAPLPFRRGTSGLVLVLPRGGQVAGSLRIPEGMVRGDFELSLEPQGERADQGTYTRSAMGSGRFRFDGLRTGSFALRVRHLPSRRIVAALEGLDVRAGVACADPRLEVIELSRALHPLRVRVTSAGGAPATGAIHQLVSLPEGRRGKRIALENGVAVLASFGEPLELAVVADGYRVVRLSGVVTDQELTLREEASAVRLALAEWVAPPPAGAKLVLELQWWSVTPSDADAWWSAELSKRRRFPGGPREWTLALQLPGSYDVRFLLQHGTDVTLTIPATASIFVADGAAEQRFLVAPEADTYARALATLR